MNKILGYIVAFILFILLIVVSCELYTIPQKQLNILFLIGLIAFYSDRGSEK